MAKYPKYKYEFTISGEQFLLAVGEQTVSNNGVEVAVKQYKKLPGGVADHFMHILCITLDGGVWLSLEYGMRVRGGKFRQEFSKWRMTYPDYAGNKGHKAEQVQLYL